MEVLTKKQIPKAASLLSVAFYDNPMFAYLFPDDKKRKKILQPVFECVIGMLYSKGVIYISSEQIEGMLALLKETKEAKTNRLTNIKHLCKCIRCLPHVSIPEVYRRYRDTDNYFEGERAVIKNLSDYYSIQAVAVHPQYRGRKIISTMMRNVLAHVENEKAVCMLETETLENVKMYRHFGFQVIGKMTFVPYVWEQYFLIYDPLGLALEDGISAYDQKMFSQSHAA